jgi:hypothetical protein
MLLQSQLLTWILGRIHFGFRVLSNTEFIQRTVHPGLSGRYGEAHWTPKYRRSALPCGTAQFGILTMDKPMRKHRMIVREIGER